MDGYLAGPMCLALILLAALCGTALAAEEPAPAEPAPVVSQVVEQDGEIDDEAASLLLDGRDDYVAVPRGKGLAIYDRITIELEFLTRAPSGEMPLLSNPDGTRSSRGNYCLRLLKTGNTGRIEFGFEPTSVSDHIYVTKLARLREDFNHVAVSFRYGDGASIAVFLNGRPMPGSWRQGDGNPAPRRNDGPLLIGRAEGGIEGLWNGNIRDLAIWNTRRTIEQLAASRKKPLTGAEKGLIGYWPLVSNLNDATALGNNGTMHGKAEFGPAPELVRPPTLRPALRGTIKLPLRSRVETFKGSGVWDEVTVEKEFASAETAILVCDVWDKHWCKSATARCGAMVPKMNDLLHAARAMGVQIIHAPSDTMGFYTGTPYRLRAQMAPASDPPKPLEIAEPPLPIDDSDGGCDDVPQCRTYRAWKRQHPGIEVMGYDAVSDNGREVYNLMTQLGVKNLILMGVHTNMCVLGRSFAIRQMTRRGVRCVLVRDLTDTMYNPRKEPKVPHDKGTELVVEHIERYWCPTTVADDLLDTLEGRPARSSNRSKE